MARSSGILPPAVSGNGCLQPRLGAETRKETVGVHRQEPAAVHLLGMEERAARDPDSVQRGRAHLRNNPDMRFAPDRPCPFFASAACGAIKIRQRQVATTSDGSSACVYKLIKVLCRNRQDMTKLGFSAIRSSTEFANCCAIFAPRAVETNKKPDQTDNMRSDGRHKISGNTQQGPFLQISHKHRQNYTGLAFIRIVLLYTNPNTTHTMDIGFQTADYIVFGTYALIIVAIGLFVSRSGREKAPRTIFWRAGTSPGGPSGLR